MFPLGLLSQDCKFVPVLEYASESATRVSEVVDTLGYRGCCFLVQNAAVHDSAVHLLKLRQADVASDEDTLTSGEDIEGTSQAVPTADNTLQYIDGKPTKRYVQLTYTKDAAQVSGQSVLAVLYNSKSRPVTQSIGTTAIGEGTAAVSGETTATGWVAGTA